MRFDVDSLSAEKGAELNRVATQYQIGSGTFLKLLRIDRKEQDDSAQIKEIDKAKLALSVGNYSHLAQPSHELSGNSVTVAGIT